MSLGRVFERFEKRSPVTVMFRGTLENVFARESMDELFEQTAQRQKSRELLFAEAVCRSRETFAFDSLIRSSFQGPLSRPPPESASRGPSHLPWNHHKRTLYTEFYRIQKAAGVDLPCPNEETPGHVCGGSCHRYGFHAFRYAHARFNYANPELQGQMGHATAATTDHYRRWAERQTAQYGAYLPAALDGGNPAGEQRKNGGKESGKPPFRVVGA